jgi:hypothetical protein
MLTLGAVLPALIVTVSVLEAPLLSVTLRAATYVPAAL